MCDVSTCENRQNRVSHGESMRVGSSEITVKKMSRIQKAKGEVLLQFIAIISVFLRRHAISISPLK